jgi:hypothetical protein
MLSKEELFQYMRCVETVVMSADAIPEPKNDEQISAAVERYGNRAAPLCCLGGRPHCSRNAL